jgi:hypothetical protein
MPADSPQGEPPANRATGGWTVTHLGLCWIPGLTTSSQNLVVQDWPITIAEAETQKRVGEFWTPEAGDFSVGRLTPYFTKQECRIPQGHSLRDTELVLGYWLDQLFSLRRHRGASLLFDHGPFGRRHGFPNHHFVSDRAISLAGVVNCHRQTGLNSLPGDGRTRVVDIGCALRVTVATRR